MNLLILLPSAIAYLFCVISGFFTLHTYFRRRFKELYYLSVGLFVYSIHPLVFVVFSFLTGEQYNQIRSIFGTLQVVMALMGIFLIWLVIDNLSGKSLSTRKYILIALSLFSSGFISNGFQAKWDVDLNDWVISYDPSWGIFILTIPLVWIILEIVNITFYNLRVAPAEEKKEFRMVFGTWIFGFASILILFVERLLELNSALYLIGISGAFLLLALGLRENPYVLIPRTIGGQSLIVSASNSGVPILISNYVEEDVREQDQSLLFSGAMKGILTLLQELTGRNDLPSEFGYVDYSIMIERSEHYIAYFICLRPINPVKSALQDILEIVESNQLKESSIEMGLLEILENQAKQKLAFAIA